MMQSSKRCRDCGEAKPLTAFPRNRGTKDGYGVYCKACFSVRYRDYRTRKAAAEGRTIRQRRQLPTGQKWCPACQSAQPTSNFPANRSAADGLAGYCKPCHNAKGKATAKRLYGSTRDYHLRRRYGLTSADVDAMIEAQGGTCATCNAKPEHVDHDHATGKVRGVLCFNCNQALGNVRDSAETLTRLRSYLRRHQPVVDEATPPPSPIELDLSDYFERHRAG
jgi:hypothetical protein